MAITISTPIEMMGFTMEGRLALEPKPKPTGLTLDVAARAALHETEALTGASTLSEWRQKLAGEVPHVKLDETRGIWCAWLDVIDKDTGRKSNPGYERAKVRGEWTTRLGAIRRMRNHDPMVQERHSIAAQPILRPEPGNGSTSMLDTLASRRQHVDRGVGGTIKRGLSFAAYALAATVVVLVAVLSLWEGFVRNAITPARVAAPVVVVRPVAAPVTEPVVIEEPVLPAPRVRRR